MGLLDWIRPSPEKRLARARDLLVKGAWAEARLDALELGNLHGAADVIASAEEALARTNLAAAISWAQAGDPERVELHLDLAQRFRSTGLEEAFEEARATIRDALSAKDNAAKARARAEAEQLLHVDGRFRDAHPTDEFPLPEGISEDEADAMRARLALLHESYPEPLRDGMITLGAPFVKAVLDLEDGDAEAALAALVAMPDDEPLVLHERARAAHALGDPAAAARTWRQFAEIAGGHHEIGATHTALLLAQVEAQNGQLGAALAVLEAQRATSPNFGGGLYAAVLEGLGRLPESEGVLRGMIQSSGPHPSIYGAIARVRLRGGHRMGAMQALETCLHEAKCSGGKCGHTPPDVGIYRTLATLYLEDGQDRTRALELADTARSMTREPTWEDAYLVALAARARGEALWTDLAGRLRAITPEEDPRAARLAQHLPA